MRVVVHRGSLGGSGSARRLHLAATALAERGHELSWLPEGGGYGAAWSAARLPRQAVVVGGAEKALEVVAAGRAARARCAVLAAAHDRVGRGPLDAWAVQSLPTWLMVEPQEAEAFRAPPLGLEWEQIALWSDGGPSDVPQVDHDDTEILERACERGCVRAQRRSLAPAVFVDRDGTLVREVGYLADPADLELLPGTGEALHALHAAGFAVVMVSNQSGVGRGFFPLERVYHANARLRQRLRGHGAELDAIYFCPHRPDAGCSCRKPRTGLLERAAEDLLLDLRHSYMVGDKVLDAETIRGVGGRGVLVRTGYGRDEERRLEGETGAVRPDHIAEDLLRAAEWIVGRAADEAR